MFVLEIFSDYKILMFKGLAKLGNIVAETLSRRQMFPCLATEETLLRTQKSVFESGQKHFCFPNANFACETNVSQFSHPVKMSSSSQCCSWKVFTSNAVSSCLGEFQFKTKKNGGERNEGASQGKERETLEG